MTSVETPTEEVDAISCAPARSAAEAVPQLVEQVLGAAGRGRALDGGGVEALAGALAAAAAGRAAGFGGFF